MQRTEQRCAELTAGLLPDAEKELAAFARAIRLQFGSEQARQSIEDWMAEFELVAWPREDTILDWRRITIAASVRLAGRINLQTSILQQLTA
jgi:hypothetical protein